ncbi:uncharacterized protein EV422DRAFT_22602 [Fimicolochytrium jonesii]|uniref:uncharacterized protein n=1 Tax=Fimicolochytrium jonesii TaxID=1396493 RepID=UPI0022FDC6BE|nr:uncharacterized protein EV422DRAFT_22602 [Fimicolochytrium jonesii]KAI8827023.1 hypothetical protein EV422DRAFT_22602 [Fimicolochytrium jonesii]
MGQIYAPFADSVTSYRNLSSLQVAQGVLGVLESLVGSEGTADTSDGISKRNATIVLRHPSKPLRAVSDLLGVVCAIASETQAGQRKGLARACDLLNHASGLVSHLTANAGWSLDALQGLGTYDKAKGLSSGQSMDDVVGMVLQIVTGELILLSGMDGNQPHRLFETFEKVLQLWLQTASTAVVSPVLWLLLGAVLRCQLPGALANTSASTTTVKWMLSQGELYLKGRSLTGQEIQRALERRGNSWVSIISMLTTSLQKARVLPQPASTFVKQNVADLFAFYVNVRGNHTHLHSPPAAASLSMKQMRASPTAYCSIPTNLQDCMHRVKSLLTVHFVSDVNDLAAHIADVLRNLAILKLPHCSIGDELISLQKDFNWAIHHEERCSLYPSPMSKFGVFSMEDLHACVVFALDVFSKYCLLAAGAGKSLAPSLQLPAAQPSAAPTSPAAGILRLGVAIVCTEDACMESHECASAGSEHEILNESVDGKMTALLLDIAKRCQDQLLIPFFREPMRWKLFPAVLLKEVKSARLKEASNSSKLDCGGILPAAASPLSLLPSLRPPTRSNIAREPMKASSESSLALSPRLSGSSEILGGTSAVAQRPAMMEEPRTRYMEIQREPQPSSKVRQRLAFFPFETA